MHLVRVLAYLINPGEDGHEVTQHRCTDTGYMDKRSLEKTGRKSLIQMKNVEHYQHRNLNT